MSASPSALDLIYAKHVVMFQHSDKKKINKNKHCNLYRFNPVFCLIIFDWFLIVCCCVCCCIFILINYTFDSWSTLTWVHLSGSVCSKFPENLSFYCTIIFTVYFQNKLHSPQRISVLWPTSILFKIEVFKRKCVLENFYEDRT